MPTTTTIKATPSASTPSASTPSATGLGAAAPPSSNNQTCSTPLDYAVVRKNNIAKITEHYQYLLDTYTKAFTDYTTQNASTNKSDKDNARLILKPQTEAYNTQLLNICRGLMVSVNKDTDLIVEQTQELEKKTKHLNNLMDDIQLLRDKSTELKVTEQSQEDNVKNTQSGSDEVQFTSQIYMGINMLLVLIIIGLIVYLVYSNFTSKKNNTNTTNTTNTSNPSNSTKLTNSTNPTNSMNGLNNIYKNIKVNNQ